MTALPPPSLTPTCNLPTRLRLDEYVITPRVCRRWVSKIFVWESELGGVGRLPYTFLPLFKPPPFPLFLLTVINFRRISRFSLWGSFKESELGGVGCLPYTFLPLFKPPPLSPYFCSLLLISERN